MYGYRLCQFGDYWWRDDLYCICKIAFNIPTMFIQWHQIVNLYFIMHNDMPYITQNKYMAILCLGLLCYHHHNLEDSCNRITHITLVALLILEQVMIIPMPQWSTPNRVPCAYLRGSIAAGNCCSILTCVLFTGDPSEKTNLGEQMPDKVKEISARLDEYFDQAVSIDLTIKAMPQARSYGGSWQPGWCLGMFDWTSCHLWISAKLVTNTCIQSRLGFNCAA